MSSNLLDCLGEEERKKKKEEEDFLECLLCTVQYDMCIHPFDGAFMLC